MKNLVLLIIIVTLVAFYACQDSTDLDKKNPPVAKFTHSPSNIDTSTVVSFDASLSTDLEDPITALRFRWDFEGNQNWTDASTNTKASHKYLLSGTYETIKHAIPIQIRSNRKTEPGGKTPDIFKEMSEKWNQTSQTIAKTLMN